MEIRSFFSVIGVEPLVMVYHDGHAQVNDWDAQEKWPMERVASYLAHQQKIKDPKEWLTTQFRPQMKKIIADVVTSMEKDLVKSKYAPGWDGRFELLSMDVLLDNNLNPYLIEVQIGPGLAPDPGLNPDWVINMVEGLMDVVLEVDLNHRFYGGKVTESSLTSLKDSNWEYVSVA